MAESTSPPTPRPARPVWLRWYGVLGAVLGAAGLLLWLLAPRLSLRVSLPLGLAVLLAVALCAGALSWRLALRRRRLAELEAVRNQERDAAGAAHLRFLGRLDHEIKNPLTALSVQAAAGLALEPADPRWFAIQEQGRRLGGLLSSLRALTELESRELESQLLNVPTLVEEALEDLAAGAPSAELARRHVSVHFPAAPWPLPEVLGDEDLLRAAVHNVLANAIKYSGPGDRLEITGREEGGRVLLQIADTGQGIPLDEHALVFEELARASNAGVAPGSGMGLSLVHTIMARHGGSVRLRSRPGEGTQLTLELPVASHAPSRPAR